MSITLSNHLIFPYRDARWFFYTPKIQGQEVVNRSPAPFLYRFQSFKQRKRNLPQHNNPVHLQNTSTHPPHTTITGWATQPRCHRPHRGSCTPNTGDRPDAGTQAAATKWRHLTIFSTIYPHRVMENKRTARRGGRLFSMPRGPRA